VQIKKFSKDLLQKKIGSIGVFPIDIMIVGATGSGKSSTINALSKSFIAKVGTGVEPETMELSSFRLSEDLRFWDTPGLGDGIEQDKIHAKKIIDLLYEDYEHENYKYGFIDVSLAIIEGGIRDMGTFYKLLNDVIIPNFSNNRIIVAINQSDMAMKGRYWDYDKNEPEKELENFLENKAISIQKRVKEATNVDIVKPIYYSAMYGYNIDILLEKIIECLPIEKRKLI
jgi:predicted GTPase